MLFPDGPAARAGLQVGDVVVGVNSTSFSRKGSLAPLAAALLDAESTDGVLTLVVQRAGSRSKIKVTIPTGGKAARKPTQGNGRRAIVDQALPLLAARQKPDGGYRAARGGRNARIILTALAGLAWLGAGSDLERGPYKRNVRRAADFVTARVRHLDSEAARRKERRSWRKSNWGLAHAAVFLGELHARTPDRGVRDALHYCAQRLAKHQEPSGGWAHGPGGPEVHPVYLELNIVTGFALCGLGLAHSNGFDVPKVTLEKAEAYLKASAAKGGIRYSHRPGENGSNVGRTAACWLGYLSLGKGRATLGRMMGASVEQRAGEALDAHGTLMQSIMLTGVAAHARGDRAKKNYWKVMERDLVLARAPDGSLQPRTWPRGRAEGSNDVHLGDVWTTASWTIVLVSEPDARHGTVGFPAWFGRR